MSRIGTQSITVSKNINIRVHGQQISIDGPKGKLSKTLPSLVSVIVLNEQDSHTIIVKKVQTTKLARAIHGLSRTLVANMVKGVSEGFQKKLIITGVGYRAQITGKDLILNMGYSHTIKMSPPSDISVMVENLTTIIVSGVEKDAVGEFAAKIRAVRPPEPYKGKGIAYKNEYIQRKTGKTGK